MQPCPTWPDVCGRSGGTWGYPQPTSPHAAAVCQASTTGANRGICVEKVPRHGDGAGRGPPPQGRGRRQGPGRPGRDRRQRQREHGRCAARTGRAQPQGAAGDGEPGGRTGAVEHGRGPQGRRRRLGAPHRPARATAWRG